MSRNIPAEYVFFIVGFLIFTDRFSFEKRYHYRNYRINNTSAFTQGNCGNDCPKTCLSVLQQWILFFIFRKYDHVYAVWQLYGITDPAFYGYIFPTIPGNTPFMP
jgi:hypothetical protein